MSTQLTHEELKLLINQNMPLLQVAFLTQLRKGQTVAVQLCQWNNQYLLNTTSATVEKIYNGFIYLDNGMVVDKTTGTTEIQGENHLLFNVILPLDLQSKNINFFSFYNFANNDAGGNTKSKGKAKTKGNY